LLPSVLQPAPRNTSDNVSSSAAKFQAVADIPTLFMVRDVARQYRPYVFVVTTDTIYGGGEVVMNHSDEYCTVLGIFRQECLLEDATGLHDVA
jgi:hypothetical protein